jgi:hypothetical protein
MRVENGAALDVVASFLVLQFLYNVNCFDIIVYFKISKTQICTFSPFTTMTHLQK